MSENEMNSYRLTSMEEPTDEMLAQLMKEVAEEAKQKSEEAHRIFFQEIRDAVRVQREAEARKGMNIREFKNSNKNSND
ncbi:hypothetical protein [Bacteroides sp. UBA939]|uniref:hypothetical protein n=1 Tax=Bacteroides sp. UBA939 TaxID=1946092 RepID=UPI0025C621D4|nr:hypothetical protein [Bacteroides sp. UBA939]